MKAYVSWVNLSHTHQNNFAPLTIIFNHLWRLEEWFVTELSRECFSSKRLNSLRGSIVKLNEDVN